MLEHPAERGQHALKRLLPMPKREHVHRHRAERDAPRDGLERHEGIDAVERERRDDRPQGAKARASHAERAVLSVEALGQAAIPTQEQRPQAERHDLLRVAVVREHVLQVIEAARVRGTPIAEPKRRCGVAQLSERRGDGGRGEAEHRDTAEGEQHTDGAEHGDHALRELKHADHHRDRSGRRLASRPCEAVVELRVLEVAELERLRALQDRHVDVDGQACAQVRLREHVQPREEEREDDDAELDEHPLQGRCLVTGDDGVHHALAPIRDSERQQGHRHGADRQRERGDRRGPANERERLGHVNEGLPCAPPEARLL